MKPHQKRILKFLIALFLVGAGFLFVQTVFAQDFGVNEVGNVIALPSQDPRVFAANIIRVALGFLGIIAVAIVLYGGFMWMTSGGNEERLTKAKKILTSGVIGLVIIIMAFSITSFVISRLMEAAGVGGEGGPPVVPPGVGLPADALRVRSFYPPNGDTDVIINVVVTVSFSHTIDSASITPDSFIVRKVERKVEGETRTVVSGTRTVLGNKIEFEADGSCPDGSLKCFDKNTEFEIEVTTAIQRTGVGDRNLRCGGLAPVCTSSFAVGERFDVTPPTVNIEYPDSTTKICADNIFPVEVAASDDGGIRYIDYFDGDSADPPFMTDTGPVETLPRTSPRRYTSTSGPDAWDTMGKTIGTDYILTAKAFDADRHETISAGVSVRMRPSHCCNDIEETTLGETGVDCGGPCGGCPGDSCTGDADCAGGVCRGGVCLLQTEITGVFPVDDSDIPNGAPGNFITIKGFGFGSAPGKVFFGTVEASLPAACSASEAWQDRQIIVEVPSGADNVPIRVEAVAPDPLPTGGSANDYIDQTDDARGRRIPHFEANTILRPGICSVNPPSGEPRSEVTISGKAFGTEAAGDEVIFSGARAIATRDWNGASIVATVPPIAAGTVQVQVVKDRENSNPVDFSVTAISAAPQILRFEPTAGPIGEYVTIFGANFGDAPGTVNFIDRGGAKHLAATDFPAACSADWWKNDQIIVKVPPGATVDLGQYLLEVIPLGGPPPSDDSSDLSISHFTVNTDPAKPGICKIDPDNGPAGGTPPTSVKLYGERFGSSGTVKFWNERTANVDSGNWRDTEITTSVPSGAATGPVNVTVGTNISNSINFTVRDCREAGTPCPTGQECCVGGSCAISRPTGPGCPVTVPGQGYYFWQFSTGQLPIYPEVVEDCDNPSRRIPPALRTPPSPSPWETRTGGNTACTNIQIAARFTTPIDETTLDSDTVVVEKCTDITGADPCATVSRVPAAVPDGLSTNSNAEGMFVFTPVSLDPSSTYRVTLKGGTDAAPNPSIKSPGVEGFRLDGDKDGEEGGDYTWKFKTRDSTERCAIGWIGIFPYEKTLDEEGAKQKYNGLCLAAGDVCSLVNCSTYIWSWNSIFPTPPGGPASGKAQVRGNATLNPPIPPGTEVSSTDGSKAVAQAVSETASGVPVRVTGAITSEGKSGFGELTVNFADPRVMESWPDCSDACVNAEVGARFNTRMKETSSVAPVVLPTDPANIENPDNVKLYVWKCGNGVVETGEDCDDGNTYNDDGCGANCLNGGESACTWGNTADCNKDSRCVWSGGSCTQRTICGNGRREAGEDCDGVPFPLRCNSSTCLNEGDIAPGCGNGVVEEGEDCDDRNNVAGDGCSATCLNEGTAPMTEKGISGLRYDFIEGLPANKNNILTIIPDSDFDPNTFYKVIISGNVTSKSGVRLTELNHPAGATTPTAYAWSFKTKDDATPCAVDRVEVNPETAVLTWIGATQDYLSTPYSAPDVCSQTGQRLGAMDYNWTWGVPDASAGTCGTNSRKNEVACISNNNIYPSCGNGVKEFGEDCDDGNTGESDGCDTHCLNGGESACTWGNARECNTDKRCVWQTTPAPGRCAKTTICGNSIIEIGEDCDDGNTRSGDGCNRLCMHEGSVAGASACGNLRKETGEDCDDGNSLPGDGCSPTCLNEGTKEDAYRDPYQTATAEGLKESDVAAGKKESATDINAEEVVSAVSGSGELTVRCDFGIQEDDSYRVCQPASLACEAGRCHGSSQTCSVDADCALGVGRDTCCHFKPQVKTCDPSGSTGSCISRPDADKICRNAELSVTFDQAMDPASLTGNFLILGRYDTLAGPCPEGSTPLPGARSVVLGEGRRFAEKIKNFLPGRFGEFLAGQFGKAENYLSEVREFVNKISEIFLGRQVLAQTPPLPRTNPWCVWPGRPTGVIIPGSCAGTPKVCAGTSKSCVSDSDCEPTTKIIFSPTKAFDADKTYRAAVLGDGIEPGAVVKGIKSFSGTALGKTTLSTSISPDLFFDGEPRQIFSWTFTAGTDICVINKVELDPSFRLFKTSGEVQGFIGSAIDWRGNHIAPLPGVYDWRYESWVSTDEAVVVLAPGGTCSASGSFCSADAFCPPSETCAMKENYRKATAQNKNGEARVLATVKVTADTISRPGMLNKKFEAGADVTVFLCENPWPPENFPYEDSTFNWRSYYCRDRGESADISDDFPAFRTPVINPAAPPTIKDDLLKEFFFFIDGDYCTLSKNMCGSDLDCGATGGSCQPSSDAIGVRIYENADHLNLTDWYAVQGFRHAAPSSKTIDGYEAIQDGRTIYVAAANKSDSLYTNVYLISYNDGAHPDTLEIYNQLVGNWKFNINLNNDKICKSEGAAVLKDGLPISCSSDLDCWVGATQHTCAAPKDKLARDVKRIIDLEKMRQALSGRTIPPKLEAGTYVRAMSASTWDSWANVFGKDLGTALPADPLNKINGCGDANLCKNNLIQSCAINSDCSAGSCDNFKFDSNTCWSVDSQVYRCPEGSHIYQYRFNSATGSYEVGTDFEYTEDSPSADGLGWSNIPGLARTIKIKNVCTATAIYQNGGICGDGAIGTGEECEPGMVNVCALNTAKSCTIDSDCGSDEGLCLTSAQDCPTSDDPPKPGRQTRTCNLATCQWNGWGSCTTNCGNGIVDTADIEECDRGPGGGRIPGGGTSQSNPYECGADCQFKRVAGGSPPVTRTEWCGDGILQSGMGERCDDGDLNGDYGKVCSRDLSRACSSNAGCVGLGECRTICATGCVGAAPYCGDRVVNEGEEYCDGNTETTNGLCRSPITDAVGIPTSGSDAFTCTNDDQCRSEFSGRWPADTYINIVCASDGSCIARRVTGAGYNPPGDDPCSSHAECGEGGICEFCTNEPGTGYPRSKTRTCGGVCSWNPWGDCRAAGSCGNGIKEGSEECDDGNTNNNDSCTVGCKNAVCGDGYVKTGVEVCDAGTANGTICTAPYGSTCNYCSTACTLRTATGPTCGDGTVNPPQEQCDSILPTGNWICVDYNNPWFSLVGALTPTCPAGRCQIDCALGEPCNNASGGPNADGDDLVDACDPDDNNDGIVDGATGYPVNLFISTPIFERMAGPIGYMDAVDYDVYDIKLNEILIKTIDGSRELFDRELRIDNLSPDYYVLKIIFKDTRRTPVADSLCGMLSGAPPTCYKGIITADMSGPNIDRPFGDDLSPIRYMLSPETYPFVSTYREIRFRVCDILPCIY